MAIIIPSRMAPEPPWLEKAMELIQQRLHPTWKEAKIVDAILKKYENTTDRSVSDTFEQSEKS